MTNIEHRSYFELTKDHACEGKMWGVNCEYFRENWPYHTESWDSNAPGLSHEALRLAPAEQYKQ